VEVPGIIRHKHGPGRRRNEAVLLLFGMAKIKARGLINHQENVKRPNFNPILVFLIQKV